MKELLLLHTCIFHISCIDHIRIHLRSTIHSCTYDTTGSLLSLPRPSKLQPGRPHRGLRVGLRLFAECLLLFRWFRGPALAAPLPPLLFERHAKWSCSTGRGRGAAGGGGNARALCMEGRRRLPTKRVLPHQENASHFHPQELTVLQLLRS